MPQYTLLETLDEPNAASSFLEMRHLIK